MELTKLQKITTLTALLGFYNDSGMSQPFSNEDLKFLDEELTKAFKTIGAENYEHQVNKELSAFAIDLMQSVKNENLN